jgi:signal peptidase II
MSQGKAEASQAARFRFWGPVSALGLVTAVLAFAGDQAHKWWMLEIYGTYGLFAQHDTMGRVILIGVSLLAVVGLFIWMGNALTRLSGLAIGLIIGGALGNITDRLVHGAVADFFHFHYAGFSWYIFNIADVAIVAGVIGLLLDWLRTPAEGAA